jgi:hypothetical protein
MTLPIQVDFSRPSTPYGAGTARVTINGISIPKVPVFRRDNGTLDIPIVVEGFRPHPARRSK